MIARLLALFLGFLAMTVSSGEGANRGTPSEVAAALNAVPDSERGAEPYQPCAACHQSTGWGVLDGSVPQVAGQIYAVLLTQISDFRDRERIHPRMMPFVSNQHLAGPQNLADVAADVAALPPATLEHGNRTGPGAGAAALPVCSAPDPLDR